MMNTKIIIFLLTILALEVQLNAQNTLVVRKITPDTLIGKWTVKQYYNDIDSINIEGLTLSFDTNERLVFYNGSRKMSSTTISFDDDQLNMNTGYAISFGYDTAFIRKNKVNLLCNGTFNISLKDENTAVLTGEHHRWIIIRK